MNQHPHAIESRLIRIDGGCKHKITISLRTFRSFGLIRTFSRRRIKRNILYTSYFLSIISGPVAHNLVRLTHGLLHIRMRHTFRIILCKRLSFLILQKLRERKCRITRINVYINKLRILRQHARNAPAQYCQSDNKWSNYMFHNLIILCDNILYPN